MELLDDSGIKTNNQKLCDDEVKTMRMFDVARDLQICEIFFIKIS